MLTKLEHFLLGDTLNDSEPLHILYKDAQRKFNNIDFTSFIEAIVQLSNLGLIEATIENFGEPEKDLRKATLMEHYRGGLSDKEINIYPDVTEYYFKATQNGRDEEKKAIYDKYYS